MRILVIFALCLMITPSLTACAQNNHSKNSSLIRTDDYIESCEAALLNEKDFSDSYCVAYLRGFFGGLFIGAVSTMAEIKDQEEWHRVNKSNSDKGCLKRYKTEKELISAFVQQAKKSFQEKNSIIVEDQIISASLFEFSTNYSCRE